MSASKEADLTQFGPFTESDVAQAFISFDLDKNQYVGAAELRAIFNVLGEEVLDEEIDEMIRLCDSDGDGQVSYPEFEKMIFRFAERAIEQPFEHSPAAATAVAATSIAASSSRPDDSESSKQKMQRMDAYLASLSLTAYETKVICQSFLGSEFSMIDLCDFNSFCIMLGIPHQHASATELFCMFAASLHDGLHLRSFIAALASSCSDLTKDEKLQRLCHPI